MKLLFPSISRCFFLLLIFIAVFSCRHRNVPDGPKYLNPDWKLAEVVKRGKEKAAHLSDTTKEKKEVAKLDSAKLDFAGLSESVKESVDVGKTVNTAISTQLSPEAAADLLKSQKIIDSTNAALIEELAVSQAVFEDASAFFNPKNLEKVTDDILARMYKEYSSTHDLFKMTEAQDDSIVKAARAEVESIKDAKYVLVNDEAQKVKTLIWKRNFVVRQQKIVSDNLALKKLTKSGESNSYFATGKDFLSEDAEEDLRKNVNQFFNALLDTLRSTFALFPNDTHLYHGRLIIYAHGFTDKQKFKIGNSAEKNKALSLRRAKNMIKIILDVYKQKIVPVKFKNLVLLPTLDFPYGHGVAPPNPSHSYKSGDDDSERRTTYMEFVYTAE